jgi:nucleotide-binding universal stress UspA family protein
MFKKILVPLDGSKIAAKIFPHIVELAKTFKAKVTLMHVCYSGVGMDVGEASPGTIREAEREEVKFCKTFLGKAVKELKDKGVTGVDMTCQDGVPAREIIAYAQNNKYDLIAIGTHGHGEVAWHLGGVAERVATHATVPVLIFRTLEFKPPALKEEYFV